LLAIYKVGVNPALVISLT